jgi:hypothetical protein
MFFVPRPQHTHQPMFATADALYSHPPRYELSRPNLFDDQAYLEAQHTARLRAWQQAEILRERARAVARQRWEYEQQLAIQAAEGQAYCELVARIRAQEALRQQAVARRQALQEEQRRLAAARHAQALKTSAFQQLVCSSFLYYDVPLFTRFAQIYAMLDDKLVEKANEDVKPQSTQEPAQLPEKASTSHPPVEEMLRQRAIAESDPEVLMTLNGLLRSLSSSPAAAPSSPAAPHPEPATVAPSVTLAPAPPSQVVRKPSLEALDRLSSTFAHLTSTFTLPQPDFSRPFSPGRPGSPTTRLPYTPANRPIHEYEAALGALLGQLDAVDAEGDDAVRLRRRELVKNVEAALAALDAAIEAQRKEQGQASEVPSAEEVTAQVNISVEDVQPHDIEVPVQVEAPALSAPAAAAVEAAADAFSQSPPSLDTGSSETPVADQITPASNVQSDQDDFPLAADDAAAGSVDEHHLPDVQALDTSYPGHGTDAAISPSIDPLVDRPADTSASDTTSAPSDATSSIAPPLSSASTAGALETEEETQLDTFLLPRGTPSPVLNPTITEDLDEEAVLLDKVDSEEEWSETDA